MVHPLGMRSAHNNSKQTFGLFIYRKEKQLQKDLDTTN